MQGAGPQDVITDLGMLRPDPLTQELTLVACYEGVSLETIRDATGWPLRVANDVIELAPPTESELRVLRDLQRRTRAAHAVPPPLPISPASSATVTTT
jgi:glutaconate CoA-transferase subunit B